MAYIYVDASDVLDDLDDELRAELLRRDSSKAAKEGKHSVELSRDELGMLAWRELRRWIIGKNTRDYFYETVGKIL